MTEALSGSRPEVRTRAGRLRGNQELGAAVFRGIPFAKPPLGGLRFTAPEPVQSWSGVRDALAYGPPPPQSGQVSAVAAPGRVHDDWLTINVWSPRLEPSAALPVMVWIQGGGYVVGASSLAEYDGGRLASSGVVVVTFNYRVGMEGFGQIDGAPANRGLLDQVAALEWVRDNVQAFGGDPHQVTVFGESAGAGSVAALLTMDRAAGLFRRAIVQSAPGTFFSPELATDIATACAAVLGLQPTVADLSRVAPGRLSAAADTIGAALDQWAPRWGPPARRGIHISPVVDGDVLAETPWLALRGGSGRHIDLLVGHTRDEHRLFTAITGLLGEVSATQAADALEVFAPAPHGARRYRDAFPAAGPDELYELVNSDWLFRMPSLHLAEAQLAGGGHAHVYELAWSAPGMGGALGACHGLDVPLVFGNLDRGQPGMLIGPPPFPEAEAISAQMRDAWISFASHGDPGWTGYDTDRRLTQRFDTVSAVIAYPEEESRVIWENHTFAPLPLISR